MLLAANLVFYLWNSPAAALILIVAALSAYWAGRYTQAHPGSKLAVWMICLLLFGMLFVYKYLNFCLSVVFSLSGMGDPIVVRLLVPIGVSFFSFALVGYVFDVYRGKQPAETNFIDFAVFASYFPSIMSGPINRAGTFLPQIRQRRKLHGETVKEGLFRFCLGIFKKLVIANQLGAMVDRAYADPVAFSSIVWWEIILLYSVEIYLDFSAYSDMAIGISNMLGIRLKENFSAPYLSTTIKGFWKKWHISLTSWFRDYLYFPLGGSRRGRVRTWLNILIVFAVSGIWHGAGFTFLFWGLLNGLYQVLGDITMPSRKKILAALHISESNWLVCLVRGGGGFVLASFAWVLFRADSIDQAWFVIRRCLLVVRNGVTGYEPMLTYVSQRVVLALGLLVCLWEDIRITRRTPAALHRTTFRYLVVLAVLLAVTLLFGLYGAGFDAREFIYFQF